MLDGLEFAPTTTRHHAAFGTAFEDMNVVVIDPSRTMQTILRGMLQPLRLKRLRTYDTATEALREMLLEPPTLVITDWKMEPISGHRLLRVMRHASMDPLCFVPVVVITGHATRSAVESAFRVGAHAVLVKPLAPSALRARMDWLAQDGRHFVQKRDSFEIEGVVDLLNAQRNLDHLPDVIARIGDSREEAESEVVNQRARAAEANAIVDRILSGQLFEGEVPEAAFTKPRPALAPAAAPVRPPVPASSATLERMIRRRTAARPSPGPLAAPSAGGEPARSAAKAGGSGSKKDQRSVRTRWAEIWNG